MAAGQKAEGGVPPLRVVIAGGGTGGHIFPGIALAEAFQDAHPDSRILFAGTGNRLETAALGRTPFEHRAISSGGLKGRSIRRRTAALGKVVMGLFQSMGLLKTFKPDMVVGVGGYVSGPMVLAAWLLGIKRVLHEQNVMPGLANRMLAPLAGRVYVTFPDTRADRFQKKMLVTGNPIRKGLMETTEARTTTENETAGRTGRFTVFVFGGSQGARRINEALMESLTRLPPDRLLFIHQTGEADLSNVRSAYGAAGANARVETFFEDMEHQYLAADLVICRAGATTVAEVTALGKPVIFIPYPFAADDHQRLNAQSLVDSGAAEMIIEKDLSGELLADRILFYEGHPEALSVMAEKARAFGRPDAAKRIVEDCYEFLGKRLAGQPANGPTGQPANGPTD